MGFQTPTTNSDTGFLDDNEQKTGAGLLLAQPGEIPPWRPGGFSGPRPGTSLVHVGGGKYEWLNDTDKAKYNQSNQTSYPTYTYSSMSKLADKPTLMFSPYAWAKLMWMRDHGPTEVGGFFLFDSPYSFRVVDLLMCKQTCNSAHVEFDDMGLALMLEDLVFEKKIDQRCWKGMWWHTHPGDSAQPSGTDEQTFREKFGELELAMMFILARGGQTTCRLRANVGPGLAHELDVRMDYSKPFPGSAEDAWLQEYDTHVVKPSYTHYQSNTVGNYSPACTHQRQVIGDDKDYIEYWKRKQMGLPPQTQEEIEADRQFVADDYMSDFIYGA